MKKTNLSLRQGFLLDSSGFVGKIWPRDSLLTPLLKSRHNLLRIQREIAPNVHKTLTMLQVIGTRAEVGVSFLDFSVSVKIKLSLKF